MSINWPRGVIQAIARRRAVILIGSGVSANSVSESGTRMPTWGEFLNDANKNLPRRCPYISKALKQYNYLEACDFLKSEYNDRWNDLIMDTFGRTNFRRAPIHESIFNLDCRIVISLNFDRIYENYAISTSEETLIVKNYYDNDIRQAVAGNDRYIIKPHGSIDTISQMIFTIDDYAKARVRYSTFYEIMTALLHTHTFLCVGCGLSDPDMKLIFEDYQYKFNETPHYITLPGPLSQPEIALIQKTRGLNALVYSSKDHHRELNVSLSELGQAVCDKRAEIAQLQNW
jgi:hypothetical protein